MTTASDARGPLPPPTKGRLSRRVKNFPITPRVDLRPDDKAQRWLLSVSASDRAGLLYGISRVLAQHGVSVQLAKITTLGERVEDTFLICGAPLQVNKRQIEIYHALVNKFAEYGYVDYRTSPTYQDLVMSKYSFNNHSLQRLHETIKDAMDPNGIISPGRYAIYPKAQRKARA